MCCTACKLAGGACTERGPDNGLADCRTSRSVGQGADDGAEHHGRPEAGDEQAPNVAAIEAVVLIQRVHIGALQPVASCAWANAIEVTTPRHEVAGYDGTRPRVSAGMAGGRGWKGEGGCLLMGGGGGHKTFNAPHPS